jgi:hypothetical protein
MAVVFTFVLYVIHVGSVGAWAAARATTRAVANRKTTRIFLKINLPFWIF